MVVSTVQFHLLRRKTKNGKPVYYVAFPSGELGKNGRPLYQAVRSTKAGNKELARKLALEMIEKGEVLVSRDDLRSFLLDFWSVDSQYIRSRKAEGRKLSTVYIANSRALIENYVLPWFKDHGIFRFSDLNRENLTNWRNDLYESILSHTTVNHARSALFIPLKWATDMGKFPFHPGTGVKPVAEETAKRQIFTLAECEKLWAVEWNDPRYRAACMLSAATGMRLGEVRGLLVKNLHLETGTLDILTSYQDREGLKGCKWGSERQDMPIPHLVDTLHAVLRFHRWGAGPDHYVFFSTETPDRPIGKEAICNGLKAAMKTAGLPGGRTFHSFRHGFASYSSELSSGARRHYIGHTNETTFARYDHPTEADRKALVDVQARILPFKKAE